MRAGKSGVGAWISEILAVQDTTGSPLPRTQIIQPRRSGAVLCALFKYCVAADLNGAARDRWFRSLHLFGLHCDWNSLCDGVKHRRERGSQRDEFVEFLVADVRTNTETHANVLEAFAHAVVGPKKAAQVNVSFHFRLHLLDRDSSGS